MSESTRDGAARRRRHSPAVYRRRRLVVAVLAIVVIGLIVWLAVAQPWRGASAEPSAAATTSTPQAQVDALQGSGATESPTATESPSPTPTPTDEAVAACDPASLTVTAVTSQQQYGADEQPGFSIELTNGGDVDCTLNVGTAAQVFTVTSGSDTWWTSTDCQSDPQDMEVTLLAGQTVASEATVNWDRTRSTPETCDSEERPAAPGGGATYRLDVEIGGVAAAQPADFFLL